MHFRFFSGVQIDVFAPDFIEIYTPCELHVN